MDARVVRTGFGWDLAGYGEGNSPLCLAVREANTVTAKVIKYQQVCSPALELADDLTAAVDEGRRLLEECCGLGPFIGGGPIDLQSFCSLVDRRKRHEVRHYWQLVMRQIDFTLNGMKRLADNIGYPVARLANVLSGLGESTRVKLDETLFETYPAASLEILSRATPSLRFVYDKYRFRKSLLAKRKDKWPAWAKEDVDDLPKGEGAPKQHPV